ncbi:LysE family translocator [Pikeienuella piscinae]|uniref:LysE family translocator n=1 Tax=Pikeienuella piscinae TaxID=2748098 RepID=A0A7L5BYT8_9RHOB|nr:LysE family translocator [Pikeienuella piscinae]QIE56902.1 LysE family translocator [Pikeienuella piscinae]
MPSLETMVVVALAGLALSASPGPSMLYVLSRSVGQSRAAGLASAIGLGLGGVLLAVIAALGLAAVFQQSTTAYQAMTVVGAGYLIYLGIRMILEREASQNGEVRIGPVEKRSYARIIWQGILVEVLNPKTILFFMAFIPPFVETSKGDIALQMLVLGVLVPLTAVPSDLIVAFVGGSLAQTVQGNRLIRRGLSWLGGIFLIGIGVSLFF